jgi:hypothetical protein
LKIASKKTYWWELKGKEKRVEAYKKSLIQSGKLNENLLFPYYRHHT